MDRAACPLRILVVDRRAEVADNLAALLSAHGYVVQAAPCASTALRAAKAFRPDAALIDLGDDGRETYAVARAFRDAPELSKTFLVTMADGSAPMSAFMDRGPVDVHLVTPAAYRVVAGALQRHFALV